MELVLRVTYQYYVLKYKTHLDPFVQITKTYLPQLEELQSKKLYNNERYKHRILQEISANYPGLTLNLTFLG